MNVLKLSVLISHYHRHLLSQFLNQWRRDYLLNLRESHNLKSRKDGKPSIQTGDVVVVKSDTSKRLYWKLGLVQQLLTGTDGHVRAAIVRVPESQKSNKLLRRSVKHLFPIEVQRDASHNTSSDKQADGSSESQVDEIP